MFQFAKTYKLIVGLSEAILAIAIIGEILIISNPWIPLGILFALHLIGSFISVFQKQTPYAHIFGMIVGIMTFNQLVSMALHGLVSIILVNQGLLTKEEQF